MQDFWHLPLSTQSALPTFICELIFMLRYITRDETGGNMRNEIYIKSGADDMQALKITCLYFCKTLDPKLKSKYL